jgi:hypothetical protein
LSRILVIGSGPLPGPSVRSMGFPSLRTAQFAAGLVEGGHEVRIGLLIGDDEAGTSTAWLGPRPAALQTVEVIRTDLPGAIDGLTAIREGFAPHAVVTAGPFLPMAMGAAVAGDVPLWVDVPGDPMAEAQARGAVDGDDVIAKWREVYSAALARGDRFSTISERQRLALIGALGLAGRLAGEALGDELVRVVRGSVEPVMGWDAPSGAGPDLPDDAFVLLFSGGWNTWLDHESMAEGVLHAMAADARIHFVATGGAIAGHHAAAYETFRATAAGSPYADRFHFLGWVEARRLAAVHASADVALCVDRRCYEAELGARTRLLEAMERGLRVASTVLCEQTEAMRGCEGFTELPLDDAEGIGRALVRLADGEPSGTGWGAIRARWSIAATTRDLVDWAATPVRSSSGVDASAAMFEETRSLREELHAVHQSPTWRLLSRIHRLLAPPR